MSTCTKTPKQPKKRLDICLVERGLFPSREKARAAIMAGLVSFNHQVLDKPGFLVAEADIAGLFLQPSCPYVSRGGLKLAAALQQFQVNPTGLVCLDIGASTGGFTDCLLQQGAAKVYAIDVGYGQFDWRLRQDPRVVCLERTNARYLTPLALFGGDATATLAVMDVSFISILKILPALRQLLQPDGQLVSLIKPQFEAGPHENVKGIVRSAEVHEAVLTHLWHQAPALGFALAGVMPSPIRGKEGNLEFLGLFTHQSSALTPVNLQEVVKQAHAG